MSGMTLSEELQWRGMIKDKTFEDTTWLDIPKSFYLGSDVSSDSLTIGNLAIYMSALQLAKHGWKTVLLVGGATSLIGDPGGKDEERELKSVEEIEQNVTKVKAQVERLFANEQFELVNNYEWFKDIKYLEFLRDVGKNFSMTELIQRDFINTRMNDGGSGISYAEFSYSLIQGYDFWQLFKNKEVELQIGGSDQWGNMLSGVLLVRKKEGKEVHALSMPLVVNKSTGKKFGKSEEGAVWLDESKTSVYKFYQFWINCDDEGVESYLKTYTLLNREEIEELITKHRDSPRERFAQKRLAKEVTTLVHGSQKADAVNKVSDVLFGKESFQNLDKEEVDMLKSELPKVDVDNNESLLETLVKSGLATSKSEAIRSIDSGAVYINGVRVTTHDEKTSDNLYLIKYGKNSFVIVEAA